ncbi:DUF4185 domain-containing protein [Actinomycetospora straminea]|uniref:DUF4185 domain-containing protein n=1 Tax=Actinomycetospora straminea TaxID=663607 RepID=A0ABP9E2M0_9PSEU|nr:DUF4185 domain-containing protein [Actinomycetospora straminea]MDD7930959.1 DUF4185 domain-containing protein [Actinomycetospora straminea]
MRTLEVTKLRDLTGPGHTDDYGIGGTDLGAAALAPDGRLVAVFGDTFESKQAGGPGWRSPVILFGDPATVRDEGGVRWTGSAGGDHPYAEQVVSYRHNARIGGRFGGLVGGTRITTQLPTDLITVGDEMYLHVMACEGLGNVHWTEIHRSRDNGVTWESTGLSWPGGHLGGLFQMLTWELGPDGYVYALTTGFQRDKPLLLHRVPADQLLDAAAWEGWGFADGAWAWGNPPTPVLPGAFGELSLRRVGDQWWLALFDAGNYRIDLIPMPQGPTTDLTTAERLTVIAGCGWGDEDHGCGRVAQCYGGYILPGSTPDEIHLVVSQWHTADNWPYRAMHFRARIGA